MSYIGAQPTTAAFVTDTFSANGSGTVFTLSVAPANTNSILVAVSGVLQDPSTYSVSGTTLTFSAAPPAGTGNISVRFLGIPASGVATTAYRTQTEFTATAGQTTFSVPSYTVGYIDVYRNGAKLGTADFTATNGTTVVLASGASSGDLVQTVSFYVSSVLNAIPAVANAVTDSYINSGAVTQTKLGTGVAGNGPAFWAQLSTNATISTATKTAVVNDLELFDTANCYNTSTGRFTPNVAGYYQVNAAVEVQSIAASEINIYVDRSGGTTGQFRGSRISTSASSATVVIIFSNLIYMNGTTDYIYPSVYQNSGGNATVTGTSTSTAYYPTFFSAFLARAA